MRKMVFIIVGVVGSISLFFIFLPRGSEHDLVRKFRIDTVKFGPFVEYIPQTGTVEIDTGLSKTWVIVPIDEFYIKRIVVGLRATASLHDQEYNLRITEVDHNVSQGRFQVIMSFDKPRPIVKAGQMVRLRIELSDPSDEVMLPMGDFYKDTGGHWVFVVNSNNLVVRRSIKLGRKSGSQYFEVLHGLKPGDRVITSSYEYFFDRDSIPLSEIAEFYER